MNFFNKSLFITGGTGSFGTAYIKNLISTGNMPYKITVYSRDWQKQKALRDELGNNEAVNFVIGDIRDREHLTQVIKGHDVIIHAAAIKCIDACEQNPTECLKTNVIGTQNVIDAVNANKSRNIKALLISTDKAVMPINTYGTSKKMSEKLWINADNIKNSFSVCRYGNVVGSSGSIVPVFYNKLKNGDYRLPITDVRMTRFWFEMEEAVKFVSESIEKMTGGEMFIPEIPSARVIDVIKAFGAEYYEVGIRQGEKLHEYMIAPDDATGDDGYSSGNNKHFLTVDELRESITKWKSANSR